jgi:hypothetical protein
MQIKIKFLETYLRGLKERTFLNYALSILILFSVGDPDPQNPHVFGPHGSRSRSTSQRYGSGSFPFLIKVLSGLKQCFKNTILTQNVSKKLNF